MAGQFAVECDAGSFDASALVVVCECGGHGECCGSVECDGAWPSAPAATWLADDVDVWELAEAEDGVFAGGVRERIGEESGAPSPVSSWRRCGVVVRVGSERAVPDREPDGPDAGRHSQTAPTKRNAGDQRAAGVAA